MDYSKKMKNIKVDYLGNLPEFIDEVAKYWQAEWASNKSEAGFIKQRNSILKKLNADNPPFIILAHEDGNFVGTAALFTNDLESRPDLSPWLGGVFVLPKYRGKGIASSLINQVMTQAKKIGYQKIYLHTEHTAGLYEKLGWIKLCGCKNDQGEKSMIYYYIIDEPQ